MKELPLERPEDVISNDPRGWVMQLPCFIPSYFRALFYCIEGHRLLKTPNETTHKKA